MSGITIDQVDCSLANYTTRIDDPDNYNFCPVPNSAPDAVFFAAIAILTSSLLHFTKYNAIAVLVAGAVAQAFVLPFNIGKIGNSFTLWLAMDPPELFFFIFLPVLLLDAALAVDWHTFKKLKASIISYAFLIVIGTAVLVTPLLLYVLNLQSHDWHWQHGALFCAMAGATDAFAIAAVLKNVGAPQQVLTLLDGESLLNDASALTFFKLLHSTVLRLSNEPGNSSLSSFLPTAAAEMVWLCLGGVVLGLLSGVATYRLLRLLRYYGASAAQETTTILAVGYLSYYLGEAVFNISGVVAVVCFGLYGNATVHFGLDALQGRESQKVLETVTFAFNGLVFWFSGVSGMNFAVRAAETLKASTVNFALFPIIYIGLMLARGIIIVFVDAAGGWLAKAWICLKKRRPFFNRSCDEAHESYANKPILMDRKSIFFITWGGLRGAISLIMTQAVVTDERLTVAWTPAGVAQIGLWTSLTVLCSLLVNAPLIPWVIHKVGLIERSEFVVRIRNKSARALMRYTKREIEELKGESHEMMRRVDWVQVEKELVDGVALELKAWAPGVMKELNIKELRSQADNVDEREEIRNTSVSHGNRSSSSRIGQLLGIEARHFSQRWERALQSESATCSHPGSPSSPQSPRIMSKTKNIAARRVRFADEEEEIDTPLLPTEQAPQGGENSSKDAAKSRFYTLDLPMSATILSSSAPDSLDSTFSRGKGDSIASQERLYPGEHVEHAEQPTDILDAEAPFMESDWAEEGSNDQSSPTSVALHTENDHLLSPSFSAPLLFRDEDHARRSSPAIVTVNHSFSSATNDQIREQAVLAEARRRLLASLKQTFCSKRSEGLLSSEGLRFLSFATTQASDHASESLQIWRLVEDMAFNTFQVRCLSQSFYLTKKATGRVWAWLRPPLRHLSAFLGEEQSKRMLVACESAVELALALTSSSTALWLREAPFISQLLHKEILDEVHRATAFIVDREIEQPQRFAAIQTYRAETAIYHRQLDFIQTLLQSGVLDSIEYECMKGPVDTRLRRLELAGPRWKAPSVRDVLQSLPFLAHVDDTFLDEVLSRGTLCRFSQGETVWEPPTTSSITNRSFMVVIYGLVRGTYINHSGSHHEYFLGSGGVIGLLNALINTQIHEQTVYIPGVGPVFAQGDALHRGPVLFCIPSSLIDKIQYESSRGNRMMEQVEVDLFRVCGLYVLDRMHCDVERRIVQHAVGSRGEETEEHKEVGRRILREIRRCLRDADVVRVDDGGEHEQVGHMVLLKGTLVRLDAEEPVVLRAPAVITFYIDSDDVDLDGNDGVVSGRSKKHYRAEQGTILICCRPKRAPHTKRKKKTILENGESPTTMESKNEAFDVWKSALSRESVNNAFYAV